MKASTAILCTGLIASAAFSIHVKTELRNAAGASGVIKVGQTAPPLELPDTGGTTVDLLEVAKTKKVVMVNFWATWCTPCRVEMPQLTKLYNQYKADGFEILAVNEDEDTSKVHAYLARKPVPFPVLLDNSGQSAERYGIRAFPTTLIVDREGKVLNQFEGVNEHLEWQIKHYLEESAKRGNTGS